MISSVTISSSKARSQLLRLFAETEKFAERVVNDKANTLYDVVD